MRTGIAIAGSILVDKLNTIASYPREGELAQIRNVGMSVGGCVPNVALDLKKLSPDLPVSAIGKIGRDADGQYALAELSQNGIDTEHVRISEKRTSFTDVMSVNGGQRTFFTYAGASSEFGYEDMPFDLLEKAQLKMLHLGYFLLLDKVDNGDGERILKRAAECGIRTSIDLVSEDSDRYACTLPCLPYTDDLIINESEAGKLSEIAPYPDNMEKIAKKLKRYGVKDRVIIHSPEYSVCLSDRGYTRLASYDLPDGYIKGTTGAGDAFCAGALLSVYNGASDPEILEFASAAAAVSLSATDATSGLTCRSEIIRACAEWKRKELCW